MPHDKCTPHVHSYEGTCPPMVRPISIDAPSHAQSRPPRVPSQRGHMPTQVRPCPPISRPQCLLMSVYCLDSSRLMTTHINSCIVPCLFVPTHIRVHVRNTCPRMSTHVRSYPFMSLHMPYSCPLMYGHVGTRATRFDSSPLTSVCPVTCLLTYPIT